MKTTFKLFITAVTLSAVIIGCKKENNEDNDTSAAADNATAQVYFNDMGNIANEAAISGNVSSYKNENSDGILSACASVVFDTLNHSDADSVTVDFGTTNCLCGDGRYRRGKILVTYTGRYRDSATVVTVSPLNYYINDNQLLGTRTVTNMGHNTSGNLYYNIVVDGQIVLADNAGTITWNANKQREWLAGESTPLIWADDVYSLTGTASGTSAKGTAFSVTVTSPLIRKMTLVCRKHFIQGVFDLSIQGKATRTVDYGDGTCDNKAIVTINGKEYSVTLR